MAVLEALLAARANTEMRNMAGIDVARAARERLGAGKVALIWQYAGLGAPVEQERAAAEKVPGDEKDAHGGERDGGGHPSAGLGLDGGAAEGSSDEGSNRGRGTGVDLERHASLNLKGGGGRLAPALPAACPQAVPALWGLRGGGASQTAFGVAHGDTRAGRTRGRDATSPSREKRRRVAPALPASPGGALAESLWVRRWLDLLLFRQQNGARTLPRSA